MHMDDQVKTGSDMCMASMTNRKEDYYIHSANKYGRAQTVKIFQLNMIKGVEM